jgi:hypothetical protein
MVNRSCNTALIILLGAEDFSNASNFESSKTFANSYSAIKKYFLNSKAFHLETTDNLLDLFNSSDNATETLNKIEDWLQERLPKSRNGSVTDLIVYYVGHGGIKENSDAYYLAIRSSRNNRLYATSLPIEFLWEVIQKNARSIRKYFILDACFAGRAKNVQGFDIAEDMKKIKQANDNIIKQEESPRWGASFLCATSAKEVAKFKKNYTMFSEALLHILTTEGLQLPFQLSLSDLEKHTKQFIKDKYSKEERGGLPELHSPEQRDGNIAEIPIFPRLHTRDRFAKRILWCLDGKVMVLIEKENNESFYVDECPVSAKQYRMVFEGGQPDRLNDLAEARQKDDGLPKVSVSPNSANEYAKKVSKRLPSPEQWHYLTLLDEERYDLSGNYKKPSSTANLGGKLSSIRKYDPQHNEQIWDLVGNTFEILQDRTDPQKFYRVSSFHTSPHLELYRTSPTRQPISKTESLPIQGFRTTVLVDDLSKLDPENQNAFFIPLAEG